MVSVVIQAGGRSSRMGQDKALVQLAGRPMITHVVEQVMGLGDELLLTTNTPDKLAWLNLPMFADKRPGAGALSGLHTALQVASGDHVLIVAVDMPFLSRNLLSYQITKRHMADVIVPFWEGKYQPMHAVYNRRKTCIAVKNALACGKMRMNSFYEHLSVELLSADEIKYLHDGLTFFNVNTPQQLQKANEILSNHCSDG